MTKKTTAIASLILSFGIITLWAKPNTATAQDNSFAICAAIENNQQRLLCFDEAIKNNEKETVSQPQASDAPLSRQQAPVGVFKRPDPETFGLPEPAHTKENEAERSIKVVIKSWRKNIHGKTSFTTTKGQIWRQTGNAKVRIKEGLTNATISRSMTGGYRLKLEGQKRLIKVKRLK